MSFEADDFSDNPHRLRAGLAKGARLLGLDLGSKTIGVALSDTSLMIATPHALIKRGKLAQDAAQLRALIDAETIGALVVGMPYNMNGSEGARAQATRAFIRNLRAIDGFGKLPIALWDERLSTRAVTRSLLEADTSRARRALRVDKMAAAYILQGFLDRIRLD